MKKIFIVANWKCNKTIQETEEWLHEFDKQFKIDTIDIDNKKVIVAPSFTLLEHAAYCLGNLNLALTLAAQNVSPFDEGSYTGEVSAKQIKEFAKYAIIGHSERRNNFCESKEVVAKKIDQALRCSLTPIVCISEVAQISNPQLSSFKSQLVIAYEPFFAIGSGNPDTPENAEKIARNIKKELGEIHVLYGGSVTSSNVASFTKVANIDGVLVGKASLDPLEFLEIV